MTTPPKSKFHIISRSVVLVCVALVILSWTARSFGIDGLAVQIIACGSLIIGAPFLGFYFFEYDQWSMSVAKAQRIASLGEAHIVRGYN